MAVTTTFTTTTTKTQFGVNTFTPGDQISPDVLALDNGGFVSAYNTANGNFDLLNFYDADHNPLGGFQIPYASANTEPPDQPQLVKLTNGNVLVIWDDDNPADNGLRGRIFTQEGVAVGSQLSLSGTSLAFQDPEVTALAGGGFAISFTFGGDVFFGRYTDGGSQIGGAFTKVNTVGTTGVQNDSSITGLTDGGFVVTYTDTNLASEPLRAAVYNADGTVRTADFLIDSFGDNTQSVLKALPNGNFAVVYTDSGWAEGGTLGNGITLQIFNGSGVAQTGFIKVNTTGAPDEVEPDISLLSNGYILVTWTRPFNATTDDVYARIFDQNGNALPGSLASQFAIAAEGADRDKLSAVAGLLAGEFVTVWQDSGDSDGGGGRITGEINEITRTSSSDAASDTILLDSLKDTANGNDGDDTFSGGGLAAFKNDVINGGIGSDKILSTATSSLVDTTLTSIEEIEFNFGALAQTVTIRADQVGAGLAANLIVDLNSSGTADHLEIMMLSATSINLSQFVVQDFEVGDSIIIRGDTDGENITGSSIVDEIFANAGNDAVNSGDGNDFVNGGKGLDNVFGSLGDDVLNGNAGKDQLKGGAGLDTLTGGVGSDQLTGGSEADRFVFVAIEESTVKANGRDLILDFKKGVDKIDLSQIDAKTTPAGDQAFHFISDNNFHDKQGELRFKVSGGETLIFGDVDGDGKADFSIKLDDPVNLGAGDFIL